MKSYNTFKNNSMTSSIDLIGMPSGEYFTMSSEQFNLLNNDRLLLYNSLNKCFTFKDKDYDKIIARIFSAQKINTINSLKSMGIIKYHINSDYTVDVMENVKLKGDIRKLPVQFDYITGDFDISSCNLSTLFGCPDTIDGNFTCSNNKIQTLQFGPKIVKGNYDVSQCDLDTLEGSPLRIKKDFICGYNNLTNLKGGPKIVDGSYYVDNCLLLSLEGSPDILGESFNCSYNLLKNLADGPDMIRGVYDCSYNNIKTLKDGPCSVGIFNCKGNIDIKDFNLLPFASKIFTDKR